jgi:hypothetical protein
MAECITCEEEYSDKRLALGYGTCLDCGQKLPHGWLLGNLRTMKNRQISIANHQLRIDER